MAIPTSELLSLLKAKENWWALVYLQEALAQSRVPEPRALVIRSRLLMTLGYTEAADADLKRALNLDPLEPQALLMAMTETSSHSNMYALTLLGEIGVSEDLRQQAAAFVTVPKEGVVLIERRMTDRLSVTLIGREAALDRIYSEHLDHPKDSIHRFAPKKGTKSENFLEDRVYWNPHRGHRELKLQYDGNPLFQDRLSATIRDQDAVTSESNVVLPLAKPQRTKLVKRASAKKAITERPSPPADADLSIVIPVHNGGSVVLNTLNSVIAALPADIDTRVFVVDDASDDPETLQILGNFAQVKCITLLRTETNIGFVRAVNLGLRSACAGPVLLLNSDTFVPIGVIDRLYKHISNTSDIGTLTPFSNDAGSFSLPQRRRAFRMPPPNIVQEIADQVAQLNTDGVVDVLHGNGFALMISAECRAKIPLLSEAYLGGYYEEVDYCLRARAHGFRNGCASDCFVGHVGGLSFSDEKQKLASRNLKLLERYFPSYTDEFKRFELNDPLNHPRGLILNNINYEWEEKPKSYGDIIEDHIVVIPEKIKTQGYDQYPIAYSGPLHPGIIYKFFTRLIPIWTMNKEIFGLTIKCGHDKHLSFVLNDKKETTPFRSAITLHDDGEYIYGLGLTNTASETSGPNEKARQQIGELESLAIGN